MSAKQVPQTIDAYIAGCLAEVQPQPQLQLMRQTIAGAAPAAEEKIGYGVPAFTLHSNLAHVGASSKHLGFYPGPAAIEAFSAELAPSGSQSRVFTTAQNAGPGHCCTSVGRWAAVRR